MFVEAGVVDIAGFPTLRTLCTVGGNGGAVGGELGRGEGGLFGCAGTHLGQSQKQQLLKSYREIG